MPVSRRKFIKFATFGTATSLIAGKIWQRDVVAFCQPAPGLKEAVFVVKLNDFPALLESWGSVRIGINPVRNESEPYPDGEFYPILINRDDQGKFYVLDSECQHAGCVVPSFVGNITCPCHGSAYAIDGSIINGPTQHPLHSYPFEYDGNDTLTIHSLCFAVAVKVSVLSGELNSRIRLDFRAGGNVVYEINFREHAEAPWAKVSFATTSDGPANETTLSRYSGEEVSVYLDRPTGTGFYAVSTQIYEV